MTNTKQGRPNVYMNSILFVIYVLLILQMNQLIVGNVPIGRKRGRIPGTASTPASSSFIGHCLYKIE